MADTKHKPGCDALGGYGHGIGPCSCGASTNAAEAAERVRAFLAEWQKRRGLHPEIIHSLGLAFGDLALNVSDLHALLNAAVHGQSASTEGAANEKRECEWTNCVHRVGDICCNDRSDFDTPAAIPAAIPAAPSEADDENPKLEAGRHYLSDSRLQRIWDAMPDEDVGDWERAHAFVNQVRLAEARFANELAALAQPAPVQPGQCADCRGSGVDGDVGDDGRAVDVRCGGCDGTGAAKLPWPWGSETELLKDAIAYLPHQPRIARALGILLSSKAAPVQQEAIACVPVHPRIGPLWAETYPAGKDVAESRPTRYPVMKLYGAPVQQEAVDEASEVERIKAVITQALTWVHVAHRDKPFNDPDVCGEMVPVRLTGLAMLADVVRPGCRKKAWDDFFAKASQQAVVSSSANP